MSKGKVSRHLFKVIENGGYNWVYYPSIAGAYLAT